MGDSILTSIKKLLGIAETDTSFDVDIIMHINTVFSTLNSLGIGPDLGFMITDATPTWAAFLGNDPRLNSVKTYIYLRVKVMFDPPTQAWHLMNALNENIKEIEYRLSIGRENQLWVNPTPPRTEVCFDGFRDPDRDDIIILDGTLDGGRA